MAKNTIRLQKGLGCPVLNDAEEQCRAAFFKMRWPKGFGVLNAAAKLQRDRSQKIYQCHACRFQADPGNISSGTKLPLQLWLLGIYLIAQAKNVADFSNILPELRLFSYRHYRDNNGRRMKKSHAMGCSSCKYRNEFKRFAKFH